MNILKFPDNKPELSRVDLKSTIQSGGCGLVYKAKYLEGLNKEVAVKLIPLRSSIDRSKFVSEATTSQIMSQIGCGVNVIESFMEQECGGIVMELMDTDLFDLIEYERDEQKLKDIFKKVCLMVKQCHQRKLAHLDIKPENILVNKNGDVKLCDFGSAANFDTKLTHNVGSIYYRDPVIEIDPNFSKQKADIWSLGVLLHVMLAKTYPYAGRTDKEQAMNYNRKIVTFRYLNIAVEKGAVSPTARDLVKQLLHIKPLMRPSISQVLAHPWFSETKISLPTAK